MSASSPAERYAESRARQRTPIVSEFAAAATFALDDFQHAACRSLEDDNNVLVAAPTGAGKTVVAEFAVHLALRQGTKVFYTTPIKALSNQKYHDFAREHGYERVGLLTGDTVIRPEAPIVIMTTEVLRNMLYAQSELLLGLGFVVLDEVHYLADKFRGAVWEEVVLHLPESVRLVCLSATVTNVREFGDWLDTVRGHTEVVVSNHRPVPLVQHALVRGKLVDLFAPGGAGPDAATVNPDLARLVRGVAARTSSPRRHRGRRRGPARHHSAPSAFRMRRADVVRQLDENMLLPAIVFIFSRAGCDQAVGQLLRDGIHLTDHVERAEIRRVVESRCAEIPTEDLGVLGFSEWAEGLERGVAAHHAGLIPAFKEVVEELFVRKLVKVVFATETLALGVNMPARTVVLEKLEKFNGEARVPVTPAEYTQITGRAGRRGIDPLGHAVVEWYDGLNPQAVASLASRRTYPLNSSFRPTYNMAVNLVAQFGRERTRTILESSFAQFQADRAVVDMARSVRDKEESLAGYEKAMTCHLGDFSEYASLRRTLSDREKQRVSGHRVSEAQRAARKRELARLRTKLRAHPCHQCPEREQHARWAERWWRLKRQIESTQRRIRSRTGAVAAVFERIIDVLSDLDYVEFTEDSATLTPPGTILSRIYGERDLLTAECLSRGIWNGLDAPSLAAMACALVFEPRRDTPNIDPRYLPRGQFRTALDRTQDAWARLDDLERATGLAGSDPLATGLAPAMHAWARGRSLHRVLLDANLAAGDFVRWCKQTLDLLDQLATVAPQPVSTTARQASDAVRRGIVAYSSVV